MSLRNLLSTLLLLLLTTASFAQKPVKIYRTSEGMLYTQAQKDSILALGYPIAEISLKNIRDTSFIDIEIKPKSLQSENEFAKKFKNKKMPAFKLKTLDGTVLDSKTLAGKIVMINFWSTTCGPCIAEMPELNKLKNLYKDKVVFLAPAPEDATIIKKLLTKHVFDFIILPDAKQLFTDLGIDGYPKNFFIDNKSIIQETWEGNPQWRASKNDKWGPGVIPVYSPILNDLIKDE